MIRVFTFSASNNVLVINNQCINGVIVNTSQNQPLQVQIVDPSNLVTPITIEPLGKFKFTQLEAKEIRLIQGSGYIAYTIKKEMDPDIGISEINVLNTVRVTFSGVQAINVTNSVLNTNITNPVLKVTFGSAPNVNANITNPVLKVTFSSAQSVNANITNPSIKVTFGSAQNVNANITNPSIKVTFGSAQNVNANITNPSLKISNSTFNTILQNTNIILPNSNIEPTQFYQVSVSYSSTFTSVFALYYVFSLPPQSGLKLKGHVLKVIGSYEPLLSFSNTQYYPGNIWAELYSSPPTLYLPSINVINFFYEHFCTPFKVTGNYFYWSSASTQVFMAPSGTTSTVCSISTKKELWLQEYVDIALINLGTTTTTFYFQYIDGNSYSNTPYLSWLIAYSILFGSPSITYGYGPTTYKHTVSAIQYGSSACFDEDTYLLTKEGLKKISEIKKGDMVWNGEEWVRSETDAIYTGEQDVYYIDDVWVSATQPLCMKGENDLFVCIPINKIFDLSQLPKKEKRKTYDVILEKRLVKKGKFWWLDIISKV
ncbi:MAG: hypothetical protein QXI16_03225 [Sulfolobaceae archaeon]